MEFDKIYEWYFKDVYLFLRSISASEEIAEEITQETFTRALKSIDGFDGKKDIRCLVVYHCQKYLLHVLQT